jgi:molecular chaperone DnaK
MAERVIVGIDLGTTYSAIAMVDAFGKPEVIPNAAGERTTPSVIYFEPDSAPLIGRAAKDMRAGDPQRVVEFIKREMGNPNYVFLPDPEADDEDVYSPEELSALILQKLKKDAEQVLGKTVTDAVITVPAYFRDAQRQATLYAGQIAGLNVLEIINEPTAAALAFGFNRRDRRERILVYDLGGGTFDVTLLEIAEGDFKVVASDGDSNLGGKDFDDRLIQHFYQEFQAKHGIDLSDDMDLVGELRERAERAKIKLSDLRTVRERITSRGKTLDLELTRQKFDELTEDLVGQTEDLVSYTLSEAKCAWSDIDHVVLVGGSTRIPMVATMLERLSGKAPSRAINPDEAVALGAALRGWLLSADLPPVEGADASATVSLPPPPKVKVRDAAPHSLGVVTINREGREQNTAMVRKNTEIPCSVSREFPTAEDRQTHVLVKVTQGEDVDLDYCVVVGEFMLGPLPERPRGQTLIQVTFSYDKNGSVKVTATDKASGKAIVSEITGNAMKVSGVELSKRRQRISGLARVDD